MSVRLLSIFILSALAISGGAPAALAKTCSDVAIEARGEQSRFMWSAKGKARANWRSKVRRTPELGAKYANWARAENTEERCLSGSAGVLCIFVGTPCLP
jgi:hypothetical protein